MSHRKKKTKLNKTEDDLPPSNKRGALEEFQSSKINVKVEKLFRESYEPICSKLEKEYKDKWEKYDLPVEDFMKMIEINV